MMINTDTIISISEANQNFSKVARLVEEKGAAVIMKNNAPKYIVIEFSKIPESEILKYRMRGKYRRRQNRRFYTHS